MSRTDVVSLCSLEIDLGACVVHALHRPGPAPVVFVHGLAASSLFFAEASDRRELDGRGLLAIDLPGFGKTAPPAEFGFTMSEHARVVAAVVDVLDVRDATLVGHSMGGAVSVLALDAIAGRVARVVLAEAVLSWDESIWTDQVARTPFDEWVTTFDAIQRRPEVWARGGMLRRRRDAIERIAPAILDTSASAMHASARGLQREASDPALYERFLGITRPLEYVFGDHHDNTSFCARVCADGVRVRFVRRAGHLMMLDNPDDFYAIVGGGDEG